MARGLAVLLVAVAFAAAACGRNPVLGQWEIDPAENPRSAVLAADAAEMAELTFRRDVIASGGTEIGVSWVVEEGRVRAVRKDGRGEHRVELLPDGRIRVELPIGVTAVYRRAG